MQTGILSLSVILAETVFPLVFGHINCVFCGFVF